MKVRSNSQFHPSLSVNVAVSRVSIRIPSAAIRGRPNRPYRSPQPACRSASESDRQPANLFARATSDGDDDVSAQKSGARPVSSDIATGEPHDCVWHHEPADRRGLRWPREQASRAHPQPQAAGLLGQIVRSTGGAGAGGRGRGWVSPSHPRGPIRLHQCLIPSRRDEPHAHGPRSVPHSAAAAPASCAGPGSLRRQCQIASNESPRPTAA